jgi:hypothetical protein
LALALLEGFPEFDDALANLLFPLEPFFAVFRLPICQAGFEAAVLGGGIPAGIDGDGAGVVNGVPPPLRILWPWHLFGADGPLNAPDIIHREELHLLV